MGESAHVHAHVQHPARLVSECISDLLRAFFFSREFSNDCERRPDTQEDSCGDPHLEHCVCVCVDSVCVRTDNVILSQRTWVNSQTSLQSPNLCFPNLWLWLEEGGEPEPPSSLLCPPTKILNWIVLAWCEARRAPPPSSTITTRAEQQMVGWERCEVEV